MTPEELEEWLETEESQTTGWSASGEGEAVGHQSGRKIVSAETLRSNEILLTSLRLQVEILRKNPKGNPEDYDEEDIKHMRKVSESRRFFGEAQLAQTADSFFPFTCFRNTSYSSALLIL